MIFAHSNRNLLDKGVRLSFKKTSKMDIYYKAILTFQNPLHFMCVCIRCAYCASTKNIFHLK